MQEKIQFNEDFFDQIFMDTIDLTQDSRGSSRIVLKAALEELELSLKPRLSTEYFAIHAMRYAQLIELVSLSCHSKRAFLEKVWMLEKFAINILRPKGRGITLVGRIGLG